MLTWPTENPVFCATSADSSGESCTEIFPPIFANNFSLDEMRFFIFGFYLKVFSTNLVDQMNMIFCLTQLKFLIFGMGRLFAQRRLFVFRNGFRLDDGDAVRWLAEPRYDSSKQKLKAGNGLRKNFTHVRETWSRRFTRIEEKKYDAFRKCAKYLI